MRRIGTRPARKTWKKAARTDKFIRCQQASLRQELHCVKGLLLKPVGPPHSCGAHPTFWRAANLVASPNQAPEVDDGTRVNLFVLPRAPKLLWAAPRQLISLDIIAPLSLLSQSFHTFHAATAFSVRTSSSRAFTANLWLHGWISCSTRAMVRCLWA